MLIDCCDFVSCADCILKNIKVLPGLPERYVREEARVALEKKLAEEEAVRIEKARLDHIARVEAGESSEDEAYWAAKVGDSGIPMIGLPNLQQLVPSSGMGTSRLSGSTTERTTSVDLGETVDEMHPQYYPTRKHMEVMLASEVNSPTVIGIPIPLKLACDSRLCALFRVLVWIPSILWRELSVEFLQQRCQSSQSNLKTSCSRKLKVSVKFQRDKVMPTWQTVFWRVVSRWRILLWLAALG